MFTIVFFSIGMLVWLVCVMCKQIQKGAVKVLAEPHIYDARVKGFAAIHKAPETVKTNATKAAEGAKVVWAVASIVGSDVKDRAATRVKEQYDKAKGC